MAALCAGLAGVASAATKAAPVNTAPPTISGTAQDGETLTANDGTWTGTGTITYVYQWQRCDKDGGSCSAIGGANAKTYALKSPDVGNTLRLRVTATNADGSTARTTPPTALVAAKAAPAATTTTTSTTTTTATTPSPVANGCPAGTGSINVATIASPARLLIDGQSITPSPVGGSTQSLTVRFHVSACSGRPVEGALVYGTAVPFSQFSTSEQATGADGWASLTMNRQTGYPASRKQQLLVIFTRARKPGENALGGISTRRLVSFPVKLSQ
jgi:hypothetical protein